MRDEPECSQLNLRKASNTCKAIIDHNGPFKKCHKLVNPGSFFEDCVYDICMVIQYDLEDTEILCQSLSDYAEVCRESGEPVDWRTDDCEIDCKKNEEYFYNHHTMEQTCGEPVQIAEGETAEGCFCSEGKVRAGNKCVSEEECIMCVGSSGYIPMFESHLNQDCTERCTCNPSEDPSMPPTLGCSSDVNGCTFGEECKLLEGSSSYSCEAIVFSGSVGEGPIESSINFKPNQPSDAEQFDPEKNIEFINFEQPDLDCLKHDSYEGMTPTDIKYGNKFNNKAQSTWIKPNACCDGKPYNDGVEGCNQGTLYSL
jgi:hypothetical protein